MNLTDLKRWMTARRAPRAGAVPDKEAVWNGYYRYYLSEAERKGVNALAVLDEQWADGRTSAACLFPYLTSDAEVLEIACGIGRVSRFVAPRCGQLTCTDILPEALREARTNLKEFTNVSFQKTNGYDLSSFLDGTFDCVYSFTAFFHFDFELVLVYIREIQRVLKPGGTAVLEFKKWTTKSDVLNLADKIEKQGGIRTYEAERDKWRYVSRDMLRLLCETYGLTILNDDVTQFAFRK